jgi:hypothetical protein
MFVAIDALFFFAESLNYLTSDRRSGAVFSKRVSSLESLHSGVAFS